MKPKRGAWRRSGGRGLGEAVVQSPQTTAQTGKHLVTRDELDFTSIDLTDTALNLDSPRLFDVRISRTVERLNEGKSEFRPLGIGQLGRLL
jgi:hypothetical protein